MKLLKLFITLGITGAIAGICYGGPLSVEPPLTFSTIVTNGVVVSQTTGVINAWIEAIKIDFSGVLATGNVNVATVGGDALGDSVNLYTNNKVAASLYHSFRKTTVTPIAGATSEVTRVAVPGSRLVVSWDASSLDGNPTAKVWIVTSQEN